MAGLVREVKAIGDPGHPDTARSIAVVIVKELCDRHEIDLT